ncbi:MAG: AcrR family transcriptional regulator [Myxococcota bacterium]
MDETQLPPARERLLMSGAAVFAEKGYAGGSTREICARASTGTNMVHHYFGNKAGLLDAIIERFGSQVLALPVKLLAAPAQSRDDLVSRIEMLFAATMDACLEHSDLLKVAVREDASPAALGDYADTFVAFLDEGKRRGLVRAGLDTSMLSGVILDRVINQVLYAPGIKAAHGVDISDPIYRTRWCAANADYVLHGMLPAISRSI